MVENVMAVLNVVVLVFCALRTVFGTTYAECRSQCMETAGCTSAEWRSNNCVLNLKKGELRNALLKSQERQL